jgi:acetyltransferase-like isoleucine patch superfamily enzyme
VFGEGVHVGANAVCRNGIAVADYALLGIGAVVVRNVEEAAVIAAHRS